jgi:hypothetical protein
MIEGLVDFVSEHLLLISVATIFLGYIDFIVIKLIYQKKVIPIYDRPFPWTWDLFVQSLSTDTDNVEVVFQEAFPWWKEFLILLCVICVILVIVIMPLLLVIILASLPLNTLLTIIVIKNIL